MYSLIRQHKQFDRNNNRIPLQAHREVAIPLL